MLQNLLHKTSQLFFERHLWVVKRPLIHFIHSVGCPVRVSELGRWNCAQEKKELQVKVTRGIKRLQKMNGWWSSRWAGKVGACQNILFVSDAMCMWQCLGQCIYIIIQCFFISWRVTITCGSIRKCAPMWGLQHLSVLLSYLPCLGKDSIPSTSSRKRGDHCTQFFLKEQYETLRSTIHLH